MKTLIEGGRVEAVAALRTYVFWHALKHDSTTIPSHCCSRELIPMTRPTKLARYCVRLMLSRQYGGEP